MINMWRTDTIDVLRDDRLCYWITDELLQDRRTTNEDNARPGLLLNTNVTRGSIFDLLNNAKIDLIDGRDELFDAEVFKRTILYGLMQGRNAAGWKVTLVSVMFDEIKLFFNNDFWRDFAEDANDAFNKHSTGEDDTALQQKGNFPATVVATWKLAGPRMDLINNNLGDSNIVNIDYSFQVRVPKASGNYPKHRYIDIDIMRPGVICIHEIKKYRRREITFLTPSRVGEQPVRIRDYYM